MKPHSAGPWSRLARASKSLLPACERAEAGPVVVFQCGDDAHRCASIIAQEQAHLLGLQHTSSLTDVMNGQFSPGHDGFEDRDNRVAGGACGPVQNSYRLMLERLGPWPGGPKPSPTEAPAPQLDAAPPGNDATITAADAGAIAADAGAIAPDAPTTPAAGGRSAGRGCAVGGPLPIGPCAGLTSLGGLILASRKRSRVSSSRTARRG